MILYHSVLYHTAPHCTAPHSTALHCTVPYLTVPQRTPYCTVLHRTVLHCTALHCTVMQRTQLHFAWKKGADQISCVQLGLYCKTRKAEKDRHVSDCGWVSVLSPSLYAGALGAMPTVGDHLTVACHRQPPLATDCWQLTIVGWVCGA